jgi:hypothetical protein
MSLVSFTRKIKNHWEQYLKKRIFEKKILMIWYILNGSKPSRFIGIGFDI